MSDDYSDGSGGGDDDDLFYDFDAKDIKKEQDFDLGTVVADGRYHAMVESVAKDNGAKPCFKLTFTILAGTVEGQANRKIIERLYITESANKRLMFFANRLGLIAQADFGKPHVRKSWSEARGKQVIIEVVSREYDKKDGSGKAKSTNISFAGVWRLDDPEVKAVPRSERALGLIKDGSGGTKAPPASQAAADAFDDL